MDGHGIDEPPRGVWRRRDCSVEESRRKSDLRHTHAIAGISPSCGDPPPARSSELPQPHTLHQVPGPLAQNNAELSLVLGYAALVGAEPMSLLNSASDGRRIAVIIGKVFLASTLLLLACIVAAYYWASVPPSRPANVAPAAVWLWGPRNPLPGPKHGTWVVCGAAKGASGFECRMWDQVGRDLFRGAVIPYPDRANDGQTAVQIDTTNSGGFHVPVGAGSIPLIQLQNGQKLIPANAYDETIRFLNAAR